MPTLDKESYESLSEFERAVFETILNNNPFSTKEEIIKVAQIVRELAESVYL